MKNIRIAPPPQRYMNLAEIYKRFGDRGVVAYSCKFTDGVPDGGFVVAVQDGPNPKDIKEYLRQFMRKYPARGPILYIKVPFAREGRPLAIVFDNGAGEKKALPPIEIKKSKSERLIEQIPEDVLALMISTAFNSD